MRTYEQYFWKRGDICLREWREKDIPALQELLLWTENRLEEERGVPLPPGEEDAEVLVEWANEQKERIWLVIADKEDRMAGYIVASSIDAKNGNAFLHVTVLPEYRRCGYATTALEILGDYLFGERRLHKINATIIRGNHAAQMFLERFGMCRECEKRDMFFVHGEYKDAYYYGMNESEFIMRLREKEERGRKHGEAKEALEWANVRQTQTAQDNRPDPVRAYGAVRENFWQYGDTGLRPMNVDDCAILNRIRYDSEACRLFNDDVMLPCAGACIPEFDEEHTDFAGSDDRTVFAVANEEGECVGAIQLQVADYQNGTFSFGIYIDREHRQRGYGAKALYLLLEYAFREQRLHKCNTMVNEGNAASLQLMYSMGFQFEGMTRDRVFYNHSYVDTVHLGMTSDEFEAVAGKWEQKIAKQS